MRDAHLSGRHRRAVRTGLLGLGLALGLAPVAQAQEPFVERIPNAYRDLTRSQQATTLPLTGDDEGLLLEVGFPFVYFGQTYTQVGVTTEGYLTFGTAVNPGNEPIPSDTPPDAVIAPFWDDLDLRPSPGAKVLIERWGVPGSRALTVQWQEVALKADPAARLSFQVVLFEGTNAVHLLYGTMKNGDGTSGTGRASGSSATIGFEAGDGRRGVQVAFEQAGVVTGANGGGTGVGGGTGGTGGTALVGLVNGGWALVTRPALPEGRSLGDLDGDGRVTVLDQSRQVELRSPRYRPGTTLELVAADVAPLDSNGALWGDGLLAVADRDVLSRVIVGRDTLPPYLSELMPGSPAPGQTLTVTGSGFDASDAARNVLVLTVAGGGTREVRAATVNPEGSRITLTLPAEARRGPAYVRVDRPAGARRTNARTLGVAGVPAILALAPDPAVIGQTVALAGLELPAAPGQVTVTIGGQAATVLAVVDGPVTAAGLTRIVTLTVPPGLAPGSHPVQVTVGDATSEPFSHRFGDLPVVVITAPTDDGVILDRFMVQGTVQDADLDRYELAYAALGREADADAWTTFHTGTAPVTSGDLGRFDPTMLLNGYYVLRARAVDQQGLTTEDTARVSVQGTMKLGQFTLTFVDLELPASGINVQVVREYDTRDKERRDFGVGWAQKFVTLNLDEDGFHNVFVDDPQSARVEFEFDPKQRHPLDPRFHDARFTARDAFERASLDFETPDGVDEGNHVLTRDGVGNWFWFPEMVPFDPRVYRLTQLDGTVLRIDDSLDLLQVIKPTGVTLTISREGIIHSGGRSVVFTRDVLDRITRITDPNGHFQTYEYDARGDLVKQTDALGFATTFTYRSDHHLIEWLDPRGVRVQKNEYDDAGRLVATVDPFGNRIEFDMDLDARRVVTRDKLLRPTITEYDDRGRATKIIGPDGFFEQYTHNDRNQVLTRRDRNGKLWTFEYDPAGNESAFVDPEGNRIEYTYDANGRILTVKDADGGWTRFTYDPKGNVIREEDPAGGFSTRTYDDSGNVTSVTDEGNETTLYTYNGQGSVTRKVEPNGQVTLYTVDPNGNVLTETKVVAVPGQPSARSIVAYTYDAAGHRASVRRHDGTSETFTYGEGGRLKERLDSQGRHQVLSYDELGRLKERIGGDGRVEKHERDAMGNVTAIEDANGRKTGTYDDRDRLHTVSFPDGSSLTNDYDAMDRLVGRTDGRGRKWTYEYDDAGRLVREVEPDGVHATVYGYNGKGQVISRTDPDNRTTNYEYDGVGRLLVTRFPDGRTVESVVRDAAGHVTRRTDAHGRVTEITLGTFEDRSRIEVAGAAWQFGYDGLGRVTAVTDPLLRETQYRYDALSGKRLAVVLPLGQTSTTTWREGRPTSLTDFDGRTTTLNHDGRGNLTLRVFPDGTGERRGYDGQGRLEVVEDVRGATRYVRDPVGRVLARIEPDGRKLEYGYDGNGNVTTVKTPAGTIAYGYDDRNRLASVTDVNSRTTTFTYTPAGVLRAVDRPGGIHTEIESDPVGRVLSLAHSGPGGPVASYAYDYDPDTGNRTRVVEQPSGRVVEWRYDDAQRLLSETRTDIAGVTSVVFAWDEAGNRKTRTTTRPNGSSETVTYVVDANDRLLREDVTDTAGTPWSVVYGWDAAGRLLSRTAPDGATTFGYDGIGRVTSTVVTRGAQRDEVLYRYDHEGNRVQTVRNGVVTNHLVDAVRPFPQVLVDTDATGAVLRSFAHGAAGPVAQVDASGPRWLLPDGQLSTRQVVDGGAAVVATYAFDAWGIPLGGVDPATDRLYTGEVYEPLTGLYHLRSRDMDPRTGRFTTRDAFEGFALDPPTRHAYLYALGNPVNRIDPPGTFSTDLNCMLNMDLPQALAGLGGELNDPRMRRITAMRTAQLLSSLNVFLPQALDVINSDKDLMLAYALVQSALQGDDGENRNYLNARTAPGRASRTWLFGAKVHARIGPDLKLAMARQPIDAAAAHKRLIQDDIEYSAHVLLGGSPEPQKVNTRLAESALYKEVKDWVLTRANAGDLLKPIFFEFQRDAEGNQVGWNRPDIAFTVATTRARWNVIFVSQSVPTMSQVDRCLTNDPRCIAIELREDGTLSDFLDAIRNGGDTGPPAKFILSTVEDATDPDGLPLIIKEALPVHNKRPGTSPSTVMVGVGVYAHNGEFLLDRCDLTVPGRGINWEFRRVYRSGVVFPDRPGLRSRMPLGHNWTTNYDVRIGDAGGGVLIDLGAQGRAVDAHNQRMATAGTADKTYQDPPGIFASIAQTGHFFRWIPPGKFAPEQKAERGYLRRGPNGTMEGYNAAGWLVWQRDRHGNTIELIRDVNNLLRLAVDTVGRQYRYEYQQIDERPLLVKVVDETSGREILLDYDPQTLDLVAVTSPGKRTERYTYSSGYDNPALNHNMLSVTLPAQVAAGLDVPAIVNTYKTDGPTTIDYDSVVAQTFGGTLRVESADGTKRDITAGGTTRLQIEEIDVLRTDLEPNAVATKTTVTDRRGKSSWMEFGRNGNPVLVHDEAGYETRHRYNEDGLRVETIHPTGQREVMGYDRKATIPAQRSNLIVMMQFSNVPGERAIVTEFDYEPFFNQLRRVSETEGFEPVTASPDETRDARTWLVPNADYEHYSTMNTFDYQEGPQPGTPTPLKFLFGFDLAQALAARAAVHPRWAIPFDQTDVNLDGEVGPTGTVQYSAPGFRGVVVKAEQRPARLHSGAIQRSVSLSQYNRAGQILLQVDAEGNTSRFEYYPDGVAYDDSTGAHPGYLHRTIADDTPPSGVTRSAGVPPVQAVTTLAYDAYANVRQITDAEDRTTVTTWDPDGVQREVRRGAHDAALNYLTRTTYDGDLRPVLVEHEDKGATNSVPGRFFRKRVAYDLCGSVVEEASQLTDTEWLVTRTTYDEEQLPTRTTFPEGNAVAWEHDDRRLRTVERRGPGTADESVRRWAYDGLKKPSTLTLPERDGMTRVVVYRYDSFSRLFETVAPQGAVERRHYDLTGQLAAVERLGHPPGLSPSNNDTSQNVLLSRVDYVHDERKRVTEERHALFGPGISDLIVAYRKEYDRLDRVVAEVDPDGDRIEYAYDGLTRLINTRDAVGNEVLYHYDNVGNVLRKIEIEKSTVPGVSDDTFETGIAYDGVNRPLRMTDSGGQTRYLRYDSRDNLVATLDALGPMSGDTNLPGNEVRSIFDRMNRLVESIADVNSGGVPGNLDLSNVHNSDGLVRTRYEYDKNSRLTKFVDDNANSTIYGYDQLDRQVAEVYADNTRTVMAYNADNTLLRTTDPNGTVVTRTYDAANRLTLSAVTRGDGVAGTTSETYQYDGLDRVTRCVDDVGSVDTSDHVVVTAVYDSLSRVLEERQNDRVVRNTWAADGRRLRLRYPGGRTLSYSHDAINRIREIADTGSIAGCDYVGPVRPLRRRHGNATTLSFADDPTTPTRSTGFDAVRRVERLRHYPPTSGAPFVDRQYSYNRANRRLSEQRHDDGGLADRWEHDSLQRIVRSTFDIGQGPSRPTTELRYLLDGVSNRREVSDVPITGSPQTVSYEPNALNQYVRVGATTRTHSAAGELLDDGRFRFKYDHRHRLVEVRRRVGNGLVAQYRYDCLNRRAERRLFDPESSVLSSVVRTSYDGWREIEDRNTADQVVATFVYGPLHLDDVLQVVRTTDHPLGEAALYLHQDVRGNVVAVTDATGAVVERRLYDDYGNACDSASRLPVSGSLIGNPFGFQGRRLDEETGLLWFRNRHYDPATGRFIQRDPVWDAGNLGNQYTFAWNDPASLVDPTGEFALLIIFSSASAGFLNSIANSLQTAIDLKGGRNLDPTDRMKALEEGFMGALVGGAYGVGLVTIGMGAGVFGGVGALFKVAGFVGSAYQFSSGGADLIYGLQTGDRQLAARGAWDAATAFLPGKLGMTADLATLGAYASLAAAEDYDSYFDNCFLAGTLVDTTTRGRINVEEVCVDDRIAPPPGHESCADARCGEVVRVFRNTTDRVVTITAVARPRAREHRAAAGDGGEAGEEDGKPPSSAQTLRCTPGHPFFVQGRGWVFAGDLRAGDAFEARGNPVVVAALEVIAARAQTFNFEVRCHHTYFVSGDAGQPALLVHNDSRRDAILAQGFQEHHILTDKRPEMVNHPLLKKAGVDKAGFDLQSRANKIFLPSDPDLHPTRTVHLGRHRSVVTRSLLAQMDQVLAVGMKANWSRAQYDAALRGIISEERQALRSGERALNKNQRSWSELPAEPAGKRGKRGPKNPLRRR